MLLNSVVHRAIEELSQHLVQFEFSKEFHDIAGKGLPLKEVLQVITAGDQGPHKRMKPGSLGPPHVRRLPEIESRYLY